MTKDDVSNLWKEANGWDVSKYEITLGELEAFAKLVAEHERERILDICKEGLWDAEGIRYHLDAQARNSNAT